MKAGESVGVYSGFTLQRAAVPTVSSEPLKTPQATADFFRPLFDGLAVEQMFAVGLSASMRPIGVIKVAQGGYTLCEVDPRVLFTALLLMGPVSGFVLCHNHPSGDPAPSAQDVALTRQLGRSGQLLCMRCLDHIVLGDGSAWVSMLTAGLMEVTS